MKKTKLLLGLTSLGLITTATPIIATSCSNSNSWNLLITKSNELIKTGSYSKGAIKLIPYIYCDDILKTKMIYDDDNELSGNVEFVVSSSDEDIVCTYVQKTSEHSTIYAYSPEKGKEGKATITIKCSFIVPIYNENVQLEQKIEIEVIDHYYSIEAYFDFPKDAEVLTKDVNIENVTDFGDSLPEAGEGSGIITKFETIETSDNIKAEWSGSTIGTKTLTLTPITGKEFNHYAPGYIIIKLTIDINGKGTAKTTVEITNKLSITKI